MPDSVPFNIAIIGAGGISGAHSAAVTASGGALAITAVVDPAAENRDKLAAQFGAKGFASVPDLLKAVKAGEVSVGGAVVCTPPSRRVDIIGALLKAGIPVLSEKPLAHTASDAKKIASLATRNRKTLLAVGYCHRFTPAVNQMMAMAAEGRIGRITRFENAFACDLPGHQTKWFSEPKAAGGGAYIDMGSHSIDLFHYMLGPSKTVGAALDFKWPKRTETGATVLVKLAAKPRTKAAKVGLPGLIISGWAETSRFTVSLVGTGGTLSYDYEKPTELVFKDLLGKAEVMNVESHDVRFARQLAAFAQAVTSRGKARTNLATAADGAAAAIAVDRALKLGRAK